MDELSFRRSLSGALAIFLGFGTLALIALTFRPLGLIILAISIAAAIYPLVQRLEKRLPRNVAIIAIYLAILVIFLAISALLLPILIQQAEDVSAKLPDYINRVERWLQRQEITPDGEALSSGITENTGGLFMLPITVFSSFTEFVLMMIMSLYFLFESESIKRFFLSMFPQDKAQRIESIAAEALQAVGGFIRGLLIDMVLVGVLTTIGLTLIGVNFALVLGIIAGLFDAIPIIGPFIASVPMILIALLDSPTKALLVALFFLALQQFEGNFLIPAVMHHETRVSPLLILIAITIGGALGGVIGILMSIPLVAVLKVLMRRVFVPMIREQTGAQM